MRENSKTQKILARWWDFRLKIFAEGILTGFFVGMLIVAYRFTLEQGDWLRDKIYSRMHSTGLLDKAWWFLALICIGYIIGKITEKEPSVGGSGIPQVEGILSGHLKMNWLRVVLGKFFGGLLSIGAGLSLGREGPSIQLGAAIGQGISRLLGRLRIEERYLITSGASAGLAAAFNAPLAGVIFALEELHKNFSSVVLTSAMAASLTADFVSQKFFGQKPVFNFRDLAVLPLNYYLYLLLLGLIIGLFGIFFNRSLIKTIKAYKEITVIPKVLIPVIPLLIGGILGFYLPETLGGGHKLIESIGHGNYTVKFLLILLTVKFLFTMVSYGSGVPGGIFLPLLVIGALAGDIYGSLAVHFLHLDPRYVNNFIVLAMAAYFTAIVKAPVTGSVLITEMTGSFEHLLPLITVSMVAYLVTDIFHSKPIYEELLQPMLKKTDTNAASGRIGHKSIIEIAVCLSSKAAGKHIKDIVWPNQCLLVAVKRGEKEILPKGNTIIHSGDYLIVLTNEDQVVPVREALLSIAGEAEGDRN